MNNLRIVNVIASTKLDKEIDIEYLATHLENVEYNPEIWPAMVWRRSNPKATIIMFSSGKVTSIGTKSEKEARLAIEKAVRSIAELKDAHYHNPTIENVVAIANLNRRLDLDVLVSRLQRGSYGPRKLPRALFYREDDVTFLIFSSGSISITGAKSERQAKKATEHLFVRLNSLV